MEQQSLKDTIIALKTKLESNVDLKKKQKKRL